MDTQNLMDHVDSKFSRIYLGGIPSLLNDDGAFLSFINVLTAIEALGGFLCPSCKNGQRFKRFITAYFPAEYGELADDLWKMRNATIHAFSPGPFSLTHHNGHLHLTTKNGQTILNAEDSYAALVHAARRYFIDLRSDNDLQEKFKTRCQDKNSGVLVVSTL